ncbi:MAG: hypothetical protein JWN07_3006 [Hyphomicrobiales bacterium]|nr:hypothetical protein [Hyphomicrobiales bacterium]
MIVRPQPDGSLILANQSDHAKLSGVLAAHWGNAKFAAPEPRESFVRAAAFHDCGWFSYETRPNYDLERKAPPNFPQVPLDTQQLAAFQGGLDWLWGIDAYAGLLVSRHRTGLWRNRYGAVAHPPAPPPRVLTGEVEDFIAHNERKQEDAIAALDGARFRVNYQLLQMLDLMSLFVCTSDPREDRLEHVPTSYAGDGKDGLVMTLAAQGDGRVKVSPFPFDRPEVEAAFVYRHLPAQDFASQEAFRIAYFGAAPKVMTFTFV